MRPDETGPMRPPDILLSTFVAPTKKPHEADVIWLAAQRIVDATQPPSSAQDIAQSDDRFDDDPSIGRLASDAMHGIDQEVAARLAALERLDPSQKRPTPKPNRFGHVNYIEV